MAKFLARAFGAIEKALQRKRYRGLVRFLLLLARITLVPEAKLSILADQALARWMEIMRSCITPELAKSNGEVTLLACALITNLVSPSVTCNQGFDLGLRCATESLPKRCFERLIIQLWVLLDVSKAKPIEAVWVAALRLLRFACCSPYYTREVLDLKRYSLKLRDITENGLFTHEVACLLFGLATEITRVDYQSATDMFGFQHGEALCELSGCDFDAALGAFFEVVDHRPGAIEMVSLGTMQKCYRSKIEVYTASKMRASSPSLPRSFPITYPPIDPDYFFDAINLRAE
jgi:hypothetical protein